MTIGLNVRWLIRFATGIVCTWMLATFAPANQEIEKLISQLQSAKSLERNQAALELVDLGEPAIKPLFDVVRNQALPIDARKRSAVILYLIAKDSKGATRETLSTQVKSLDLERFRRVKSDILRLRSELLGEIHMTTHEASQKLQEAGCRVIHTGNILRCYFSNWTGDVKTFRCLIAFRQPMELRLPFDMELEYFEVLPELKIHSLYFDYSTKIQKGGKSKHTAMDDKKFASICKCQTLETLNLNNLNVSPEALKGIRTLTELTSLTLPSGSTDKTLESIASLKKLNQLSFGGNCDLSGAGFAGLSNHPGITTLNLRNCRIGRDNFRHLGTIKNLASLTLPSIDTTDAGMKQIAKLTNLKTLTLDNALVTDKGLANLVTLQNLTYLRIGSTPITDRSAKTINQLKALSNVYLYNTLVTADGFEEIDIVGKNNNGGRVYKPKSKEHYKSIQKMHDRGIVFVPDPQGNLTARIHDSIWDRDIKSVGELKKLKVQKLELDLKPTRSIIEAINELDKNIQVQLIGKNIGQEDFETLRKHFSIVHDLRENSPNRDNPNDLRRSVQQSGGIF